MPQPRILQVQKPGDRGPIRQAADVLRRGGLVVMPTDTVYGLAADARLPGSEERIFEAKSRERGKPIPLLAASQAEVERFGATLDVWERRLARRYWPGPLTLVLRMPGGKSEGFRVPDHKIALTLLRESGGVLRVTSANVSGAEPALTADQAVRALGDHVELVLDTGRSPGGKPSTVVRVENGQVHVLRPGAIPEEELCKAVSSRILLFVCTGNVCRSPMAEYLARHRLDGDSGWEVASAGTSAVSGMPASRSAMSVLADDDEALHVDMTLHRSQLLNRELVDAASLIVVMTGGHRDTLRALFPEAQEKVYLLRSFDPKADGEDLADPIGLSENEYRRTRNEICAALPGLLAFMKSLE